MQSYEILVDIISDFEIVLCLFQLQQLTPEELDKLHCELSGDLTQDLSLSPARTLLLQQAAADQGEIDLMGMAVLLTPQMTEEDWESRIEEHKGELTVDTLMT